MAEDGDAYNEDMKVLSIIVVLLFLLYAATDLAGEPAKWYQDAYGPSAGTASGGGGQGGASEVRVEELIRQDGNTAEGSSDVIDFKVSGDGENGQAVLGNLTVVLTWTDDIGSNDEFGISLLLEGDEVDSVGGTAGSLEIPMADPTVGNYSVVVTAVNCPGRIEPLPVDRDQGNDWTLVVTMEVVTGLDEGGG